MKIGKLYKFNHNVLLYNQRKIIFGETNEKICNVGSIFVCMEEPKYIHIFFKVLVGNKIHYLFYYGKDLENDFYEEII